MGLCSTICTTLSFSQLDGYCCDGNQKRHCTTNVTQVEFGCNYRHRKTAANHRARWEGLIVLGIIWISKHVEKVELEMSATSSAEHAILMWGGFWQNRIVGCWNTKLCISSIKSLPTRITVWWEANRNQRFTVISIGTQLCKFVINWIVTLTSTLPKIKKKSWRS